MSEHMLRKGAAWWRHEIIMHKMFLDKLNTLFFLLPVLFLFSLNVIVYVFLTVWTLESWELVFLLYWNKSSLVCLLVKRNQIRGKNRLPPGHRSGSTTSLFICRRGEAESAFLKCSRSEDAYAIEAAEARTIQTLLSQKHPNQTAHRPDRTGSENMCYTSLLPCTCEDAASTMG